MCSLSFKDIKHFLSTRECNWWTTNSERCNRYIESQNGTIVSPNYPNKYQPNLICEYVFQGSGIERIQLKFLDMSLRYTKGDPKDPYDCSGEDMLSVFITLNGTDVKLGDYCGQKKPPMLMSSEPKMRVRFQSKRTGTTNSEKSGFKLQYTFRKDFGITVGQQDGRKLCTFNYYSTKLPRGNITSPNYPGLYPRNTECHYLFYGRQAEKVFISFPEFDVDGVPPRCDKSTNSDYVSFSNFRGTDDRKMSRFCGKKMDTANVSSDGGFFRVTFKSNNVYDAEGFRGEYQFINTQSDTTTFGVQSSASRIYKICELTYSLLFLLAAAVL
ncbi:hypothetical protein ScPMuIL_012748 [Solemya velum]